MTALSAPRTALALTVAKVSSPSRETLSGPRSIGSPPRTNGRKTATKRTSGSTAFARDQRVAGRMRARAATVSRATAQAT
jgi:hypothetical protein